MQPVDKYKYAAKLANKSMQSVDKYKATSKQIQVCDQQTYTTKRLGDKGESSWFDKDSDGDLKDLTETAARRNSPLQWRLRLGLHFHQVVVVELQVEVVLDEPLKGSDLLQRPSADLHHLGGGGIGTGVCAQTA